MHGARDRTGAMRDGLRLPLEIQSPARKSRRFPQISGADFWRRDKPGRPAP